MTKIDSQSVFTPRKGANTPLVDFWIDVMAPKFLTYRHVLVEGLTHHSDAVMPSLPLHAGDHVLDVGSGFGDTALALAKRVGPMGHVLGVDCVPGFVELSKAEAVKNAAGNLSFLCADAETDLPQGSFDYVFSRFGTMFFTNPVAGLRTMRKALKPGGRMTHVVWRARDDNPFLAAARDVLLSHLPAPDANAQTCGPGPFSMADKDVTRAQMVAAGFEDIRFHRIDAKVLVGRDVEEAIAFQLALGPAGEIFRTTGDEAERKRGKIIADLRTLFQAIPMAEDGIWMESSSWVIHARG